MAKKPRHTLPIIHSMLICERVIVEEGNKKKTLVGIFDRINCKKTPMVWPELGVYIALSDVEQRYNMKLELVYLEDNRQLFQVKGILEPRKSLNWELIWTLRGIRFEKWGEHAFRFWVDDDIIGEKYLRLRSV